MRKKAFYHYNNLVLQYLGEAEQYKDGTKLCAFSCPSKEKTYVIDKADVDAWLESGKIVLDNIHTGGF